MTVPIVIQACASNDVTNQVFLLKSCKQDDGERVQKLHRLKYALLSWEKAVCSKSKTREMVTLGNMELGSTRKKTFGVTKLYVWDKTKLNFLSTAVKSIYTACK